MKKADKMLWEGVEENDIRKVALALNLGADVNVKDVDGESPLHVAVYRNNVALKAKDGMSPLHSATDRNNVALAKLLISVGADVNAKDGFGDSPLHVAVDWNSVEFAEVLISAGADVNAKDKSGMSPLYWANYEEMKSLLKQHGATL